MAHDIKNSLASINLVSDMLINYQDKLKEEDKIIKLKNIKSTSKILSELLNELLIWSKSQSGDLEINNKENDIIFVLNKLISLYNLKSSSIEFESNFDENDTLIFVFDSNILNTILRNLLSNAIKFSGENGKISMNLIEGNDTISISIEDNGIGMTKEQIEILLDISKSKKLINNSKKKGTGFGINLCLELTEKIQGEFLVESEPNKGTKMTIKLPKNIN